MTRTRVSDQPLGALFIFVIVVLVWALSACGQNDSTGKSVPKATATATNVSLAHPDCRIVDGVFYEIPCTMTRVVAGKVITQEALEAITLEPTPPPGPVTSFTEGVYEVGSEIQPGKYKSEGGNGCYWARLGADPSDILDNHFGNGPNTLIVKQSDKFVEFQNCTWALAP